MYFLSLLLLLLLLSVFFFSSKYKHVDFHLIPSVFPILLVVYYGKVKSVKQSH